MVYQVENIKKDVKVCLDENVSSQTLLGDNDENQLQLEEIIASKLLEAVEKVHQEAPYYMLDNAHHFNTGASINWKTLESGEILLPDDFMRLVVFQMSDWERPVYKVLTPDDPEYAKCSSRYKALRGTVQRPVCALAMRNDGRVLEFYSCNSTGATITRAVYVPYPEIDAYGGVDIAERCYNAVVNTIAGLTLVTCGEADKSQLFFTLAKNNLHIT